MMISAVLCFTTVPLLAVVRTTPLNVKTGQWEGTTTIVTTGSLAVPPEVLKQMTPEQRARAEAVIQKNEAAGPRSHTFTEKDCITEKDLSTDPFRSHIDPNQKCTEHVIRSTGTDFEVQQTCTGEGATSDMHITFHAVDSEHVTGKGEISADMGGHAMHSQVEMKGKWLGATCPAK